MDFKNYEDNFGIVDNQNKTNLSPDSDVVVNFIFILFIFIVILRIIEIIYNKLNYQPSNNSTSRLDSRTRSNEILGENYEEIEYQINHNESDTSWDVCPICIEMFTHGSKVIELECKHYYHKECIMSWYQKKKICPLCNI